MVAELNIKEVIKKLVSKNNGKDILRSDDSPTSLLMSIVYFINIKKNSL